MDLSGFVRRFQSSGDAENKVHQHPLSKPQGLTVDTSVTKESQRMQPQWSSSPTDTNNDSPPGSGRTSATATPTATPTSTRNEDRNEDSGYHPILRRRRSNSECLMLAKSRGGQDLPGPCKEYIAGVKQILARSEEATPTLLRRRSSMSLKSSPLMTK
jgi:hypothetical protein